MVPQTLLRFSDFAEISLGTDIGHRSGANILPRRHNKTKIVHAGLQGIKRIHGNHRLFQEGLQG